MDETVEVARDYYAELYAVQKEVYGLLRDWHSDPERCHGEADALYEKVLRYTAENHPYHQTMARMALRIADHPDLPRYCA